MLSYTQRLSLGRQLQDEDEDVFGFDSRTIILILLILMIVVLLLCVVFLVLYVSRKRRERNAPEAAIVQHGGPLGQYVFNDIVLAPHNLPEVQEPQQAAVNSVQGDIVTESEAEDLIQERRIGYLRNSQDVSISVLRTSMMVEP